MTPPQDDRLRRPPPATGRQDRHGRAKARLTDQADDVGDATDEYMPHVAPRGQNFYEQSRQTSYGFGCLIAAGLIGIAAAAVLVIVAFLPTQEDIGIIVPAPGTDEGPGNRFQTDPPPSPLQDEGAGGAAAPAQP
jgi:hypothetical protein